MSREPIDLGLPEVLPSGKVRWNKMHLRNRWKSSAYDQDSRRNRAFAWQEFLKFRDQIDHRKAAEQRKKDEQNPLRLQIVNYLLEEIELAKITEDSKQIKWATDVLAIVRRADELGLEQTAEMLDIPHPGEESDVEIATRSVVQHVISKAKKPKQSVETMDLVEEWLSGRSLESKANGLTAGAVDNLRNHLTKFNEFCPQIVEADEAKVAEFRLQLLEGISKGDSPFTARDCLLAAKNFLEWCGDTKKVIAPIKTLRKRGTGIKVPSKRAIEIWEDEDVADLFETVTGELRLYLLLMFNTGAYESDIGTWTHIAVNDKGRKFRTFDASKRTVTFKRHKERDEPTVPTVTYPLWDETFELFEEHMRDDSELIFSTSTGAPLWIDEHNDSETGRVRKSKKMIGKWYRDFRRKHQKMNWGTLDDLRKTAISKFDDHGEYARFSQYWAGHAPQDTINSFYRKPSASEFKNAIGWLGDQFGFHTT